MISGKVILFMVLSMVSFLISQPLEARAQNRDEIILTGPILSIWKGSGLSPGPQRPAADLFLLVDEVLDSPAGKGRYRLVDKDHRLLKTIMARATGVGVTLYVSTVIPGLIVGIIDFDGKEVRAELTPASQASQP